MANKKPQPVPRPTPQPPKPPGVDQVAKLTNVIARLERDTAAQVEAQGKELGERIEAALLRSLDIQESNDKVARRQNMKDIKALRSELKMARKSGVEGDNFGEFEVLLDKFVKQSVETTGLANKVVHDLQSDLSSRMPTLDGLLRLAGASNPMIGMGLKLIGTASRNIKEARRSAQAERTKRLQNLKTEAEANAAKLKDLKAKKESMEPANDPQVDRGDGRDENGRFLKSTSIKQLDVLIKIYERLGGTQEELQKSVEAQRSTARLAAKSRSESEVDKLRLLGEEKPKPKLEAANDPKIGDKKTNAMLEAIAGEAIGNMVARWLPAIGVGMAGALGGIAKVFTSGTKLLKVAGKASVILTAVLAVFDFADGFQNAGDMLGKKGVNLTDKVAAGLISVVSGITGIIDDVAGLVGIDTDLGGKTKAVLVDFYNGFITNLIDSTKSAVGDMLTFGSEAKASTLKFIDEKTQAMANAWTAVSEFDLGEWLGEVKNKMKKKVEDMFDFVRTSIEELLISGVASMIEVLPEFARTSGMNEIVERKNALVTRKQAEKDAGFAKSYERTNESIKDEKERREAEKANAATANVVQQNSTKVSNHTTIGQPKINVANPDRSSSGGLAVF